jgi:hypothetical protein
MIGDLILLVKRIIKQQILCIHDYQKDRIGIITDLFHGRICTKCKKIE